MGGFVRVILAAVVVLASLAPVAAAMPLAVRIDGVNQGWIQGDNFVAGQENTIELLDYHHLVATPAGTATPKHEVVILLKRIDKSTPKLWRAYDTRETLTVQCKFYRIDPSGTGDVQQYYTATFNDARIVGIEPISVSGADDVALERVRLEYRSMTVLYVPTGVTYTVQVP